MALELQDRLFELPDIQPPCNFRRALLKLSGEALMGSKSLASMPMSSEDLLKKS